jgi:hypothetical protein
MKISPAMMALNFGPLSQTGTALATWVRFERNDVLFQSAGSRAAPLGDLPDQRAAKTEAADPNVRFGSKAAIGLTGDE